MFKLVVTTSHCQFLTQLDTGNFSSSLSFTKMVNTRGPVERARAMVFVVLIFITGFYLTVINGLLWPFYKVFDPTFSVAHRSDPAPSP